MAKISAKIGTTPCFYLVKDVKFLLSNYISMVSGACQGIALVHVIIHSGKVQYVEKWVKV